MIYSSDIKDFAFLLKRKFGRFLWSSPFILLFFCYYNFLSTTHMIWLKHEINSWSSLSCLSPSCLSSCFCKIIIQCYLRLSSASWPPYPHGLIFLLIILINICFPSGAKHCHNILLSAIITASISFENPALTLQLLSLCASNLIPFGINTYYAVPCLFMGTLPYAHSSPQNPQQIQQPGAVFHTIPMAFRHHEVPSVLTYISWLRSSVLCWVGYTKDKIISQIRG